MTDYELFVDELVFIRKLVREAKEILGMGGFDCVYRANKELEIVDNRLRDLIDDDNREAEFQ